MWFRKLGRRSSSQLTLSSLHTVAAFSSTVTTSNDISKSSTSRTDVLSAFNGHQQRHHHYAIFRRFLREMGEGPLCSPTLGTIDSAIDDDRPLTGNVALMEQLGVMDLAERRTCQFTVSSFPSENNTVSSSLDITLTEACKAGVACYLPPIVVLQRVATAAKKEYKHAEWLPSAAVTVLLRCAAERIITKTTVVQKSINGLNAVSPPHDADGWPRSDQGEVARLQWALREEIRHGYGLLARLPLRRHQSTHIQGQETNKEEEPKKKNHIPTQYIDELRARLQLAAALQDGILATDIVEELFTFYYTLCKGEGEESEAIMMNMTRDVSVAISAFSTSRNFAAGCSLYERCVALMPLSSTASGNESNTKYNIHKHERIDETNAVIASEKLRLLTALTTCIDANAAHFAYVRDIVVELFTNTEVGYYSRTQQISQEILCVVLHALSRVTLEPHTKMNIAQLFFCKIQQNSHADVCLAPCITEALLQVASVAFDANVALLLYNQLAAPNIRRAEKTENMVAILLTEKDAINDMLRFLSFVTLRRRVITSSSVHLLAVKLLLQRRPSETVYTVLDLIQAAHEVEPQRVFFLRLLVFYRDLQIWIQQSFQEGSSFVFTLNLKAHTQQILETWRDELRRVGVTTVTFTTLQLLQHIRQCLVKLSVLQDNVRNGEDGTSSFSLVSLLSLLIACIDDMLYSFSFGWLRHRAAVNRTPRYYLSTSKLRSWMTDEMTNMNTDSNVVVRTLHNTVICPSVATTFSAEARYLAVRRTFDELCAAADAGDLVVLGFSDYVRLCCLEDISLMCINTTAFFSSSSVDEFCFSLERLNSCMPLVYITDALGELILQDEMCVSFSSSISSSTTTTRRRGSVVRRDIHLEDILKDSSQQKHDGTIEEKWLKRWLEESRVFSQPVCCGVFERHLERLLRMTSLSETMENTVKKSEGKESVLQCFVSVE